MGVIRPTKKLPRRSRSDPVRSVQQAFTTGSDEIDDEVEELLLTPSFSRWSSDPLMDSLSSLGSLDRSMDRSSLDRSLTEDSYSSNAFARRTESLSRHAPSVSRASSRESESLRAALPPQLPKRRVGDAEMSWNAMPPQMPSRKQNSLDQEDNYLTTITQSA
jgi:hypothetical protein